jgi:serine/threonine protein kinase
MIAMYVAMRGPLSQLGRYKIIDKVASGGMAVVYRARIETPAGMSHSVALKVLHPHLVDDADAVAMFLHEAKLGERFLHENLVTVFDSGKLDGWRFIAMDYVPGVSLATLQEQLSACGERLDLAWSVWLAREVLSGLSHAHELEDERGRNLGVVHRDVSPHNVLLSEQGTVKLIDFGVAAAANPRPTSELHVAKGTAAYMAPEQLSGQRVDARADLYAVGVLLYELTAGERLYDDRRSPVERYVERAAQRALKRVDGPPRLRAAVARALSENPDDRYPDAQTFAEALDAVLAELQWRPDRAELAELVEAARAGELLPAPVVAPAETQRKRPSGRHQPSSADARDENEWTGEPTSGELASAAASWAPPELSAVWAARLLAWAAFGLFAAGLVLELIQA